jgi:hypothetical protein
VRGEKEKKERKKDYTSPMEENQLSFENKEVVLLLHSKKRREGRREKRGSRKE